jgi:septum site-determining protein MinC
MRDDIVAIKGIKDGLLISLNTTEEWLSVTSELASRIDEKSDFFAGAVITVDIGPRPVPKHELSGLRALLERRGLSLNMVLSDSLTTIEAANALDLRSGPTSNSVTKAVQDALPINPEEEGTLGVLIRRTLRSGRTVHSQGHAVIFGDVNPGAEVIAGGDIVIWGKLRGNVHAGAYGDEDAVVCALDMTPTQLRIAGYISTSPPDKRRKARPEVASIRGNQIVVEAWE